MIKRDTILVSLIALKADKARMKYLEIETSQIVRDRINDAISDLEKCLSEIEASE